MMIWVETIRRELHSRQEETVFNDTNRRVREVPLSNSNAVG